MEHALLLGDCQTAGWRRLARSMMRYGGKIIGQKCDALRTAQSTALSGGLAMPPSIGLGPMAPNGRPVGMLTGQGA